MALAFWTLPKKKEPTCFSCVICFLQMQNMAWLLKIDIVFVCFCLVLRLADHSVNESCVSLFSSMLFAPRFSSSFSPWVCIAPVPGTWNVYDNVFDTRRCLPWLQEPVKTVWFWLHSLSVCLLQHVPWSFFLQPFAEQDARVFFGFGCLARYGDPRRSSGCTGLGRRVYVSRAAAHGPCAASPGMHYLRSVEHASAEPPGRHSACRPPPWWCLAGGQQPCVPSR